MSHKIENRPLKAIIFTGFCSGLLYAGFMVAFDYFEGEGFRLSMFIFNTVFFGLAMAVMFRYKVTKTK